MKKVITIILCLSLLAVSFTSCLGKKNNNVSDDPIDSGNSQTDAPKTDAPEMNAPDSSENIDVNFVGMEGDWWHYSSADELIEKATFVCTAKIVDITFEIVDSSTLLPITSDTPQDRRELRTIYHYEVIEGYKGVFEQTMTFSVDGGLPGYKEAEQIKLMKDNNARYAEWGIPVWEGYTGYEIGDCYLLVLTESEKGVSLLLNLKQSVYSLTGLTEKDLTDGSALTPVTPKTVIEAFGDDALEGFIKALNDGSYAGNPETEPPETSAPITLPPVTDTVVTAPPVTEPPVTGEVETDSDPMDQPPETFLPETE